MKVVARRVDQGPHIVKRVADELADDVEAEEFRREIEELESRIEELTSFRAGSQYADG